jgi:hypothetical protein
MKEIDGIRGILKNNLLFLKPLPMGLEFFSFIS